MPLSLSTTAGFISEMSAVHFDYLRAYVGEPVEHDGNNVHHTAAIAIGKSDGKTGRYPRTIDELEREMLALVVVRDEKTGEVLQFKTELERKLAPNQMRIPA